ncbi:hypothetical protein CJP74_06760 [Psittacicella melopsittaci]|uniref:Coenzyme Q-binding protein COQ10 START domain-containing protein n=1 Tax=Psittacicella melopsittaci TaxID=2028576 RepID=A0A3A1Y6L2_9GAMM|nr:type II toxin-antitoxin system RatA family toxin [Psittacicella melopsittaci]RIY31694.1 hypothetical protein CJP74_06760 [Psittacicella melopsittaci]
MIIEYTLEVPFTCEQMFNLVADYNEYPNFIEACSGAKTYKQEGNAVIAELEMSFLQFKKSFSTLTTFYPYNKITMELVEGPFDRLQGYWLFTQVDDKTTLITLYIDYEFSGIIGMIVGTPFKKTMQSMADSFVKRAHEKYKPGEICKK